MEVDIGIRRLSPFDFQVTLPLGIVTALGSRVREVVVER